MKSRYIVLLLSAATALPIFGQTTATTLPATPKDARAILDTAQTLYNLDDPANKPWHVKFNYQLYDEQGMASDKGVFEYWWASPKVHRVTWTREDRSSSQWTTNDGKKARLDKGDPLSFYEYRLEEALLHPLPKTDTLAPDSAQLKLGTVKTTGSPLSCVEVAPVMVEHKNVGDLKLGFFPTYCFDATNPLLRMVYSYGSSTITYGSFALLHGHVLSKEITIWEGKQKLLSASVVAANTISADDATLTPTADALYIPLVPTNLEAKVAQGMLMKKVVPVYPAEAKRLRISGQVVLDAVIGVDGHVHDLHVVKAPSPEFAGSALWAVSHWVYKPYLLENVPVEVHTTVNVVFTLE